MSGFEKIQQIKTSRGEAIINLDRITSIEKVTDISIGMPFGGKGKFPVILHLDGEHILNLPDDHYKLIGDWLDKADIKSYEFQGNSKKTIVVASKIVLIERNYTSARPVNDDKPKDIYIYMDDKTIVHAHNPSFDMFEIGMNLWKESQHGQDENSGSQLGAD